MQSAKESVSDKGSEFLSRPQPLLDSRQLSDARPVYRGAKRFQDVVLSLIGLIVLLPVMIVLAVIIVVDDPGTGPIFVQKRVGLNGKPFNFYKFRTMYNGAEAQLRSLQKYNEMDGPVFKIKKDPRITRVGGFLRKASLDELPQLVNILKGDMSLVGPRPALPNEVKQYDAYQAQRLFVKPGLTCYWQIQPQRNDISFDRWIELDIQYILDRGFLTDWKIILRTFGAVVGMHGI